jgi:hypothetical protein
MRSIMILAALSSLATSGLACAQTTLGDFQRTHTSDPVADTAAVTRTFPVSPTGTAAPLRIYASWDSARNPPLPAGSRSNQEMHCRLYDASRGLQKCGAHTRFNGQLYDPSVWYVYTFDGSPTGDAPIPVEHVSTSSSASARASVAGSTGLEHESTQEAHAKITYDTSGRVVDAYAASYEKRPSLLAQTFAIVGIELAAGVANRISYGGNGGYLGGFGSYAPSGPYIRGGSCGGCERR